MKGTSGAASRAMESAERPSNRGSEKSERIRLGANSTSALRNSCSSDATRLTA
jgi:hypothetical protein